MHLRQPGSTYSAWNHLQKQRKNKHIKLRGDSKLV